jgi:hypothetical protein
MVSMSLSMSDFRDKQRTLVNTVGVPGVAGSCPGKKEEACQNMTQQPN